MFSRISLNLLLTLASTAPALAQPPPNHGNLFERKNELNLESCPTDSRGQLWQWFKGFFVSRGPLDVERFNAETIAALNAISVPPVRPPANPGMSRQEALALWDELARHPIVRSPTDKKYDPTGNIGFCFGRAAAAHWMALWQARVPNAYARKVFLVGNMRGGAILWGWHVTFAVRAKEGAFWWAIDPVHPQKVVTVENWYKAFSQNSLNGDQVLFTTAASRLAPNSPRYPRNLLSSTQYNGYFCDLHRNLSSHFRR